MQLRNCSRGPELAERRGESTKLRGAGGERALAAKQILLPLDVVHDSERLTPRQLCAPAVGVSTVDTSGERLVWG